MNQLEHLIRFGDEDKAVKIITEEFESLVRQVQDLNIKVRRRDALLEEINFKCESRPADAFTNVLLALIIQMRIDDALD